MVDKTVTNPQAELDLEGLDADQLRAAAVAEYVLGTLSPTAGEACEALFHTEPEWAEELAVWEDRLGELATTVEPIAPPAGALAAIQKRLGWHVAVVSPGRSWLSNLLPAAIGFAAALALSVVLLPSFMGLENGQLATVDQAAPAYIAVLVDASSGANWIVRYNETGQSLQIRGSDKLAVRPDRDLQLWAIYDGKPHAVSLVPRSDGAAKMVEGDVPLEATIAISLEPRGGSTTGLPTGPVLAVGELISL